MTVLAAETVYILAVEAGADHDQAVTATAIAIAESGLNPDAVGDLDLEDATWGPSIGLWQIRSLKAESGTGASRDASRLAAPPFNAASAAEISSHWTDFGPWSTFASGAYKAHLAAAESAAPANQPTLAFGSRGPAVAYLQALLAARGIPPAHSATTTGWDGIFGPGTLAAVRGFQASAAIAIDGIVGPVTWGKLGA